MGSTDWIREDYLRPLPTQREPWPCRPDFHVGIPFGGILFRDLPKIRGAAESGSRTRDSGPGLVRIIIHVMRDPPRTVRLALADQQVVEVHG